MVDTIPSNLLSSALETLAAEETVSVLIAELTTALSRTIPAIDDGTVSLCLDGQPLAMQSSYGSLTFFIPSHIVTGPQWRLATFDRYGRLMLLLYWTPEGTLTRFKVRGLDGRFLGVVRDAAWHFGWGASDSVWVLDGETGFVLDHALTMFRSVQYEELDFLPPLDNPTRLSAGAGSTILNVLALLGQDQDKPVLRYRGPYPSERLFATLRESFRYSGETGAMRERFTQGAEQAALQLTTAEAAVDWAPFPHERFFPAAHTCVQWRDGIEKVYDRGRVYYRPDLAISAYALRKESTEQEHVQYIAGLTALGRPIEDHLVLDENGEIVERPAVSRDWTVREPTQLSNEWKAALVRLIAAESTPLLQSALWPVMDELTIEWSLLNGVLWTETANEIALHGKIVAAYRDALSRVRSAGEGLLLAARLVSELARLLGPLVRARAQEQLAALSPEDQRISLLFSTSAPQGLSDDELRAFLTRLALGEELPMVSSQ